MVGTRGIERAPSGQTILHYRGDSDSHLVRGLIAISMALFSDRAPKQILAVDAFGRLSRAGSGAASHAAALERRARCDRAHARGRRCGLSSASIRVSDRTETVDKAKDRGGVLEIASLCPWRQRALTLLCLGEHQVALSAVPALVEQARAEPQEADAAGERPASERARFTKGPAEQIRRLRPLLRP